MRADKCEYTATIWPNGEFTIGRIREIEEILPDEPRLHSPRHLRDAVKAHGAIALLRFYEENPEYRPDPLGLSNVSKTQDLPSPRGRKGLTSYGARTLRNCCFLIEEESPRGTVAFFTGTVPPCPEPILREVWAKWPEFVRRFTMSLQKKLVRRGLPGQLCHCTEIQEERWKRYGQPFPHLHVAFQGRLAHRTWSLPLDSYRKSWEKAWVGLIPELSELPWEASTRTECVKKSVAAYLAKYLTKGCVRSPERMRSLPEWACTPSWWGATGGLKRAVHLKKAVLVKDAAAMFLGVVGGKRGKGYSYRDIFLEIPGGKYWIGAVGRIPLAAGKSIKRLPMGDRLAYIERL